MMQAYEQRTEEKARRALMAIAGQLQRIDLSAARSLMGGLDETLTVHRLEIPDTLRRSLRSTNIIDSANNGVRDRSPNVKRWRDGMQVERWTAAALLETEKKFRRIKGCAHIPVLVTALENCPKQETHAT